ncbi:MAG: SWIM zinc finger family protein [Solirubrobacteraceae bacterium]
MKCPTAFSTGAGDREDLTGGAPGLRGPADDEAHVTGTRATYHVRPNPPRCTCRWWQEHPGDRGPCKHILAALLATSQSATTQAS